MLDEHTLLLKFPPEQVARMMEFSGDHGWRAALTIITSDFFAAGDRRLWRHVDLDRQSLFFDRILEDATFSSGERRLLLIAASMYSEETSINLCDVLGGLDHAGLTVAVRAIHTFTLGGRQPAAAPFSPAPPPRLG
jgi:hypothetical protein